MQDQFIGKVITALLNMLILALLYGQFASYMYKNTTFKRDISSIYERKESKKKRKSNIAVVIRKA